MTQKVTQQHRAWRPDFPAGENHPLKSKERKAQMLTPHNLDKYGMPVELFELLQLASPHGSPGEAAVRDTLIKYIDSYKAYARHEVDEKGNLIVRVGKKEERTVAFCAHMDTVHKTTQTVYPLITTDYDNKELNGYVFGAHKEITDRIFQVWNGGKLGEVLDTHDKMKGFIGDCGIRAPKFWQINPVDPEDYPKNASKELNLWRASEYKTKYADASDGKPRGQYLVVSKNIISYKPSVLGADDKVGCYILLQLIKARTPGLYIFHVGEEAGCVGSRHIASKTPELLADIDLAIAFDRMHHNQVICKQASGRCASIECGKALADAINPNVPPYMEFENDVQGSITDTNSYPKLVAECFNLSVGYFFQHTERECFDLEWLNHMLMPALKAVKWNELPICRDPKAVETPAAATRSSYYGWPASPRSVGTTPSSQSSVSSAAAADKLKDISFGDIPAFALTQERFWTEILGQTPPWKVDNMTKSDDLPIWQPSWGWLPDASSNAMRRIIAAWIDRTKPNSYSIADIILQLFTEHQELEDWLLQEGPYKEVDPSHASTEASNEEGKVG